MTKRLLMAILTCVGVVTAHRARADDCTREKAVQAIAVLQSVADGGDRFSFPTLPSDAADLGPNAGIPFIETLPTDSLSLMEKSVLGGQHQDDTLRYALQGRCGSPLTPDETVRAKSLVSQFDPWIAAWAGALPKERLARASDSADAARICSIMPMLDVELGIIAREKANPSGVVDLAALHEAGQLAQAYASVIAARKKLFLRDRKKTFNATICKALPPAALPAPPASTTADTPYH